MNEHPPPAHTSVCQHIWIWYQILVWFDFNVWWDGNLCWMFINFLTLWFFDSSGLSDCWPLRLELVSQNGAIRAQVICANLLNEQYLCDLSYDHIDTSVTWSFTSVTDSGLWHFVIDTSVTWSYQYFVISDIHEKYNTFCHLITW